MCVRCEWRERDQERRWVTGRERGREGGKERRRREREREREREEEEEEGGREVKRELHPIYSTNYLMTFPLT